MGSQDDASFREKVGNNDWGIPHDLWWGMETVDQCTPIVMIKPLTRWLFFALKT